MAGAVESALTAVNPSVLKGAALTRALSRALRDVVGLRSPPAEVWRGTYEGLRHLFTRLGEEEGGTTLDPASEGDLQTLLFGPDLATEALRLRRADVVIAVAGFAPTLASGVLRADILACVAGERSAVVRDRLGAVL